MNEVVIKIIGNYSYQTSRCLGEGVYGKVYEGQERETKEKVAVKKIDLNTFTNDKYLENAIFSEIYLLKRFSHPNIVRFRDVLSSKNSLYIITEFCKNGDLKQLIKRKRFKEEEAFEILRQLLAGFSELVKQKIIHRDLKPANILINEGVYKIADFGFAKYVDNFGSQLLKSCVGSPIYMAPQILERTQYSTKCDIWSLGVIFFEMIHGYPPWKARDQNELLKSVRNVPITQVLKKSTLSPQAAEFLKRTLVFSEEDRIGWVELFDLFAGKHDQKAPEQSQSRSLIKQNRQRRMTSSNPSSLTPPSSHSSMSTFSNSNPSITVAQPMSHAEKPGKYYNSHTSIPNSTQASFSTLPEPKKPSPVENAIAHRQYLVYYHFCCLELYNNYTEIHSFGGEPTRIQSYAKLLFYLGLMVKSRSSLTLSMLGLHHKGNKLGEELYRKMQYEHDSYEMLFADLVQLLEREGVLKSIRSEASQHLGAGESVTEDKLEKMENCMITYATENAQVLSEEVQKRVKSITSRDYPVVEMLDNILDVLRLALGRGKSPGIKDIQDHEGHDEEDIKDFVARVFGKVDRLSSL